MKTARTFDKMDHKIFYTGIILIACLALASCRKDSRIPTFKVDSAKELGPLSKPATLVGRDGGQSALISGKIIWLFGDSFFDRKGVDSAQFHTNTAAQSTTDNPLVISEPLDANGVPVQFIPFTAEEKHFNDSLNNPNDRIGLWPTGIVTADNVNALVFYSKVYLKSPWQDFGIGIAKYQVGQIAAVRNSDLLFKFPEPNFQTPFLDNGYLYLYGKLRDKAGSGIARALIANIEDRASYEFWNGSAWTKDISSAARTLDESGGSFSYNHYHKQFIHIYNEFANNAVFIQFSDKPEGPWSVKQILYETIAPAQDFNYIAVEHPELSKNNGKTIYISYHHPLPAFLAGETRLVEINFQ